MGATERRGSTREVRGLTCARATSPIRAPLFAAQSDLDATIGIHPCVAEELVQLQVTKRSGTPAERDGC